ncbi:hypothetical protein GCM10009825_25210 [Arthrobacter humicola]|uniref:Uncharacterized protein n=1 Tax=Arthrobacter humicola TaxID=409291 RepID=A0ABP5KZY6_9MICC
MFQRRPLFDHEKMCRIVAVDEHVDAEAAVKGPCVSQNFAEYRRCCGHGFRFKFQVKVGCDGHGAPMFAGGHRTQPGRMPGNDGTGTAAPTLEATARAPGMFPLPCFFGAGPASSSAAKRPNAGYTDPLREVTRCG